MIVTVQMLTRLMLLTLTSGHEESTRSEKAKSAKKNTATNFTKTKSAKAERDFWYNSRFKQPYSRGEEEAVVNYFLKNGGYSLRGGNAVWKKMEDLPRENLAVIESEVWQKY